MRFPRPWHYLGYINTTGIWVGGSVSIVNRIPTSLDIGGSKIAVTRKRP